MTLARALLVLGSATGGNGGNGISLSTPGYAWLMGGASAGYGSGAFGDSTDGVDGVPFLDPAGIGTDYGDRGTASTSTRRSAREWA